MAQKIGVPFSIAVGTTPTRVPVPSPIAPEDLANLFVRSASAPFELITSESNGAGLRVPAHSLDDGSRPAGTWRLSGTTLWVVVAAGVSNVEFVWVDDPGMPQ